MPLGHVAYAWGGLRLVQKGAALFRDADYRLVALAAIAPDLSDKALALSGVSRHRTGQVWAHTLFFCHLPVLLGTLIFRRRWLPYALAFAAGAMIFVSTEELIPESQRHGNVDIATMGVIAGFAIMMTLDVALG